jgi:hypothetical protein
MALDMNQDLDEHLFSSLIIVIISSPSDMFFSEPDFFQGNACFQRQNELLVERNLKFWRFKICFWGWELLINSLAYY